MTIEYYQTADMICAMLQSPTMFLLQINNVDKVCFGLHNDPESFSRDFPEMVAAWKLKSLK